jgi:hypothetical protein
MLLDNKNIYSVSNLYLAYRKAKAEAFYENTHFHALAFTEYEQNIHANLESLQARVYSQSKSNWFEDVEFLGDYGYLPKSIDCSNWDNNGDGHFRALDPMDDWRRRFALSNSEKANGNLRLIIRPSINFQIISALWVMIVGHLYDASLDPNHSFGNRIRRSKYSRTDYRINVPGINLNTPSLFAPYFSAYRDWREQGLTAMEDALKRRESILAITMDIEKFYHRVSPKFMLRKDFLNSIGLKLTPAENKFTGNLLSAIEAWYKTTPDYIDHPKGAIPVGLSASKIIANVLLVDFDRILVSKIKPLYYGRYVDDIFLVIRSDNNNSDAQSVRAKIVKKLGSIASLDEKSKAISIHLPYAKDSKLLFVGSKQKIFSLSSEHGSDLVHHIRDQIREQSSEYRLLPSLPTTGIAMASRALLATPNASLQVDALRKADVVSVRRLGFSLLLSDIETYALDLRPESWRHLRSEFYGIVGRHVITPIGFFDYFSFIPRVFGLMLSCKDNKEARSLIRQVVSVAELLKKTTTLGSSDGKKSFSLCLEQYANAMLQSGIQAATSRNVEIDSRYWSTLKMLKEIYPDLVTPSSVISLQKLAKRVLLSDWGRTPYKEHWFKNQFNDEAGPPVPHDMRIRRQLRLGAIRKFRETATNLKAPYWPALAFPTRPLQFDEITLIAPDVLWDDEILRDAVRLLRGAEIASGQEFGFVSKKGAIFHFNAPGRTNKIIRFAVTSVETTEEQWSKAAQLKHDRSVVRYMAFNDLINNILKEPKKPNYIVFPELSIPMRWALRAAKKLAKNGVSLLAGVEYHKDQQTHMLRNDSLISLTTNWPGYQSSVVVRQSKFFPAHGELEALKKVLKRKNVFFYPEPEMQRPVVINHNGFYFSILICSDLTNISHRYELRGQIDALVALEWNRDIKTFAALVEASANDLHAFIIQANNRLYGDSRIRAPALDDFARDIVQVKGGVADYYVLGEVDYLQLRAEQTTYPSKPKFKPLPIGYIKSPSRKDK